MTKKEKNNGGCRIIVYVWTMNMLAYLSRSTHSGPGAIVVDSRISCSFNCNPHLVDRRPLNFVLHRFPRHSLMSIKSWFQSNAMPHLKVFSKENTRIVCFTLSLIEIVSCGNGWKSSNWPALLQMLQEINWKEWLVRAVLHHVVLTKSQLPFGAKQWTQDTE